MKHKFLFFVGVLLSVVSVVNAQIINIDNIKYTLNTTDNTASVTGHTMTSNATLVIPDTIRNNAVLYKVTSIAASAFKANTFIVGKMTIKGTTLKTIGASAFEGCTGLADVLQLPATVNSIGALAFSGCTGLTGSLVLPNALTSVVASSFQGCSGLTGIVIPGSVTSIGDYAFDGCTSLTDSVEISSAVTSIGLYSFRNCKTGLKVDAANANYASEKGILFNKAKTKLIQAPINYAGDYVLPSSVTSINAYAFYKSTSITGITFHGSLTNIGSYAFSGCSKIVSALNIPSSVISLGRFTFEGCSKVPTVIISNLRTTGTCFPDNTNFKLFGNIDARDFKVLRDSLNVVNLDLGSSTIVAYTGTGGTNTSSGQVAANATFPANTIPMYAFSYPATLSPFPPAALSLVVPIYTISGKTSLKSIIFPATTTAIGNYAFGTCTGLTGTFKIPSPITSIGNFAFLDCAGLTGVSFPETLTSIGTYAFERCVGLNTPIVFPVNLKTIGSYAFSTCINIPNGLSFPEGVTDIGTYAFQCCRKVTTVSFPTSLKTIPAGVCSNSDILTSITIPESVTSIGANAFEYCPKLNNVVLPSTLTTLGGYAFYQCVGLSSIKLPAELAKIDTYTFYYCTNLKNVILPTALTTLGDYAFYSCTSLNDMTMPASLKTIGQYTFACCPKLTSIALPDLVTALPNYSFAGCTGLTNVTLPANTASIGTYTFQNCSALKTVNFPTALKTIGEAAFTNCTALLSVNIPAAVTSIGNYTFSNCSAPLFVDAANTVYASVDSILFNKALTTLIQCPISKTGNYTIPSTVTTLGDYSFYFCSKLKSIYIPASVATIGDKVFYNCTGLRSIISASAAPVNLSSVESVFGNIDPACILYVPYGAKAQYQLAGQWNEISKVVEATTAVENPTDAKFTARVVNGQLQVSNVEVGKTIDVYTLAGTFVSRTVATSDVTTLNLSAKGIYVVKIGTQSVKIVND